MVRLMAAPRPMRFHTAAFAGIASACLLATANAFDSPFASRADLRTLLAGASGTAELLANGSGSDAALPEWALILIIVSAVLCVCCGPCCYIKCCCHAKPYAPKPQPMSSEMSKFLTGPKDAAGASPPPSINVKEQANAESIDGVLYSELIRAGFANLVLQKDECNKINLFPVPDADTGTNMVISLKSGAANIGGSPPTNLSEAALGFSGRVLLSAQGNSGTILSYFFVNLGDALTGKETIAVGEFATILGDIGTKIMADAMADAKPGTMISVIEYSCKKAATSGATTVKDLLNIWQAAADEAVKMTPDQLVVNGKFILKNAGVVDSGAKGFMHIVEGMSRAIDGWSELGEYIEAKDSDDQEAVDGQFGAQDDDDKSDLSQRFCTEVVLEVDRKHNLNETTAKAKIQAMLNSPTGPSLGNSLVPVCAKIGSGILCKVHIHSNQPAAVFAALRTIAHNGDLIKEKAEDMKDQIIMDNGPQIPDMSKFPIRILFDDTADLPERYHKQLTKMMIPVKLMLNDVDYENSFDLENKNYWNNVRNQVYDSASTAGNAKGVFKARFEQALESTDGEVFYLTLPQKISRGTHQGSRNAMKELDVKDQQRLKIWTAAFTGVHTGALVLRCVDLIASGISDTATLVRELENFQRNKMALGLCIPNFYNFKKFGRINEMRGGEKAKFEFLCKINFGAAQTMQFTDLPATNLEIEQGPITTGKPISGTLGKYPAKFPKVVEAMSSKFAAITKTWGCEKVNVMFVHTAVPFKMVAFEEAFRKKMNVNKVYFASANPIMAVSFGFDFTQVAVWAAEGDQYPITGNTPPFTIEGGDIKGDVSAPAAISI